MPKYISNKLFIERNEKTKHLFYNIIWGWEWGWGWGWEWEWEWGRGETN
jgi:hypothetical protein